MAPSVVRIYMPVNITSPLVMRVRSAINNASQEENPGLKV